MILGIKNLFKNKIFYIYKMGRTKGSRNKTHLTQEQVNENRRQCVKLCFERYKIEKSDYIPTLNRKIYLRTREHRLKLAKIRYINKKHIEGLMNLPTDLFF